MNKKYLIIAIISLVLIFGGIGIWWYLGQTVVPIEVIQAPTPIQANSGIVSGEIWTNSGVFVIDSSREFNLDDYFQTWTYSIVQKFEKGPYTILTIDARISSWTINSENWVSCMGYWFSDCKNFILKDKIMIYDNLQTEEDVWWVYTVYDKWVVFYNVKWWWTNDDTKIFWWWLYELVYINFDSLKRIYEDYTESFECKVDKKTNACLKWTEKTETSKIFYDKPRSDSSRLKLNLKATNMEDAYFEFYKEEKNGGNQSQIIPSETDPIITWNGFLKTKLYVKNNLLYSFVVNDEEREVGKWNNDFRIIDKNWYFTMWLNLYFASIANLWPIWQAKTDSNIIVYECVNGLDLNWSFFVTGKKQEIKFLWGKKCIESEFINALYDDSGIYILEIPSNWELKYFPGLDGKSLRKISENEIWDAQWNILVSKCWHAGCEYTKKQ